MTYEEARKILLDAFHKTRHTWKVSVDADALYVLLYGEQNKPKENNN